ncbi:hypothetical protein Cgig2_005315 [Carnegiea gigantea]|uniref:Uncharacterized protein n=1 Tax=Carnegiea gigantea TaxID=171969 RepID=A0A9Q1JF59_9CARY|nr:hypothetical protein Cgig2_005315 [Carnegiea gigantea]
MQAVLIDVTFTTPCASVFHQETFTFWGSVNGRLMMIKYPSSSSPIYIPHNARELRCPDRFNCMHLHILGSIGRWVGWHATIFFVAMSRYFLPLLASSRDTSIALCQRKWSLQLKFCAWKVPPRAELTSFCGKRKVQVSPSEFHPPPLLFLIKTAQIWLPNYLNSMKTLRVGESSGHGSQTRKLESLTQHPTYHKPLDSNTEMGEEGYALPIKED